MKKRLPIKGEPDFSVLSDSKIKDFMNTLQQMIFSYQEDKEKKAILTEMWKQLSNEMTDRQVVEAEKEVSADTSVVVHKVKPVKRIKFRK